MPISVLGLYTLLSLVLTWPLIAHLTTQVPGIAQWAFDESTFIWNIWAFKHAVIDQLTSPLHSDLIWYPLGIDLILYTYNFYHVLAALPLALAANLPVASNLTLLASTILSGYGTFLLVHYLLYRHQQLESTHSQLQLPASPPFRIPHSAFRIPYSPFRIPYSPFPIPHSALIAGLLYAFASNRAIYASLGHYDMVTTQWIPFYALMLLRSLDETLSPSRRRKAAILAGLFFAMTGLAEMISALFLAIFTLIVVLVYLRTPIRTVLDTKLPVGLIKFRRLGSSLLITGLVAFVLWSPVLIPIVRQFLTNDFSLKGWGEAIPLSTDMLGWFTPTKLHPLFGGDVVAELRRVQLRTLATDGVGFRDINTVFLGWVSLALAVLAVIVYGRRIAIWLWTSVIFGIFTLGPFLQINGRYQFDLDGVTATFPLPYLLLHYLPIIKANRAPNRNSVVLMLGLAVLVGYGCYWVLGLQDRRIGRDKSIPHSQFRIPHFAISILLAAAILFEHLALPLPLSDARIPAVYAQIAADPRPVSVLQIPLGWRNSFGVFGPEQTQLQYFQTAHGKPMLGGNISRAPDFKMDYFARIPLFQALEKVETGKALDPDLQATARAQATDLLYLYNVGYVLLYPPIERRFPYADTWQATWAFAKQTLPLEPTPFWTETGIEAYRVIQPPGTDHFELDIGAPGTFAYRGEGWDSQETDTIYDTTAVWATAPASRLFLPLRQVDPAASYPVQVRLHPYAYPGSPAQGVQLTVNGQPLEHQTLRNDWQEVTWSVAGALLINGLNHLDLTWDYAKAPRQVLPGSRQIGNTGTTLPIDVDLKGFADGGFMALFDETGKQSDGSAGRRGVNVTVLDPQSGAVLEKAGFDTTANAYESERLAQFLQRLAPGRPVLVVSNGDATAFLTQDAVDGLRAIGADVTLDSLHSHYFAVVGLSGATLGSAAQVVDVNEAFLRISLERDRRTLAAAIDWVKIGQKIK